MNNHSIQQEEIILIDEQTTSDQDQKDLGTIFNLEWLRIQCRIFLTVDLSDNICKILDNSKDDLVLQSSLFDLIGENGFELLTQIMEHKDEILQSYYKQEVKKQQKNFFFFYNTFLYLFRLKEQKEELMIQLHFNLMKIKNYKKNIKISIQSYKVNKKKLKKKIYLRKLWKIGINLCMFQINLQKDQSF